jgi:7-carboxy-7-deazaguanine synthase
MSLIINEIFQSIQGESSFAGLAFAFIRLSGCNLRCRHCDTRYAYDEGTQWPLDHIIRQIARINCPRVTVTGGEPLLQAATPDLIARLLDQGRLVTLETNGSLDIGPVDPRCIKILDIKCPSSGMHEQNHWDNLALLSPHDEVKFVVADRDDFDFACQNAQNLRGRIPADHLLFSPVHGVLSPTQLARWMLDAHIEGRLQIQLHKYLWPNMERGV